MARRGREARKRARIAKFFARCLRDLGLDPDAVAKSLGVDRSAIRKLDEKAPQLRVLYPLGAYVQEQTKLARRS
jgi:hypothetical protein